MRIQDRTPSGKFVGLSGPWLDFLTAFYSSSGLYSSRSTENSGARTNREHHLHESPKVMTIPLIILCIGAVASGWIGIPHLLGGGAHFTEFLKPVLGHPEAHGTHAEEWMVMAISIIAGFSGIGLAALFIL